MLVWVKIVCGVWQHFSVSRNNVTDAVTAGPSGEGRLFGCHLCDTDEKNPTSAGQE
jgi:hypothetical protein